MSDLDNILNSDGGNPEPSGTVDRLLRLIGEGAGRGLVDSAPYLLDVIGSLRFSPVNRGQGVKDALLGRGPMASAVDEAYVRNYQTVEPKSDLERILSSVGQGVGAGLPGGGLGVISGIVGAAGSEAAHAAAPDSEWAPFVGGLAGSLVPSAGLHVGRSVSDIRHSRMMERGATHPEFGSLVNIVRELEGGGTFENPLRNSKSGAFGPMQVTPETARNPGYGIKPWDGVSQEDLARVGRQKLAVLYDMYDNDPAKALAAYNWGEGNVNKAVRKYGDKWLAHAPEETQNYVSKGVIKLRGVSGQEVVGEVRPMSPEDIAGIMNDPEAAGLPKTETPAEPLSAEQQFPENVTDLGAVRNALDNQKVRGLLEDKLDNALYYEDAVTNYGHQMSLDEAFSNLNISKKLHDMLPDDHAYKGMTQDLIDVWQSVHDHIKGDQENNSIRTATGKNSSDKFMTKTDVDAAVNDPERIPEITRAELEDMPASERAKLLGRDSKTPPDTPPDTPSKLDKILEEFKKMLKDESGSLKTRDPNDFDGLEPDQKLNKAMRLQRPLAREQRKLYHQALREKTAKLAQLQERGAPLAAQKAVLQGELPKVAYQSIREHFTADDIQWLKDRINFNNKLRPLEKTRALDALEGVLGKDNMKLPTDSERELLKDVFGHDIFENVWGKTAANILNLPRAIMASMDVSAPFRQGIFMVGRPEFYGAFPKMLKSFGSEKIFHAVQQEILDNPYYDLFRDHRLALTLVGKEARLVDREEAFMTRLADELPGVKNSNRAYVAYLNKVRSDVATDILDKWKRLGIDFENQPELLDGLFDYINTATGRGSLGKYGNRAAPFLNTLAFSTRLIASRFKLLSPVYWTKMYRADPQHLIFKEAVRDGMAYAGFMATVLSLGYLSGLADVEANPSDPDGWKLRIGNSRIDVSGGVVPWIRMYANIAKFVNDEYIKGKDDKSPFKQTGAKRVGQFLRNKESPIVSLVHDFLDGQNTIGEDFDTKKAIVSRMTPMITQTAWDAYWKHGDEPGPEGLTLVIPEAFGMAVTTYKDRGLFPKEINLPPSQAGAFYQGVMNKIQSDPRWALRSTEDKRRIISSELRKSKNDFKKSMGIPTKSDLEQIYGAAQ